MSPERPSQEPGRLARLASALRQLAGMPDYAAYLRHAHAAHAGEPVLTEREFFERHVAARYGDGPTRCC